LLADYREYADYEGALTLMSGWTGVDFSRLDPDQVVKHVESEAGRTALENITRADPDRCWTVCEVAEHVSIGGMGPVGVGGAQTRLDGGVGARWGRIPRHCRESARSLDRRDRSRWLQSRFCRAARN